MRKVKIQNLLEFSTKLHAITGIQMQVFFFLILINFIAKVAHVRLYLVVIQCVKCITGLPCNVLMKACNTEL